MPRGIPKKQPDAQDQQNGAGRTKGGRINKLQCVRDALHELGNDAQPRAIQDFLKHRFDLDMNTKFIGTYKGTILRGKSGQSGIMRTPAATAPAEVPVPPKASPQVGGTNGGISVDDIRAIKALVDRLGADGVRQVAEVLSE
ncbi:MAG TPA: hypothetical protein VKA46_24720 [Gemmataceae bacterium]|nr:hypothetical protein [Gemmataceae bacterium]